MKRKEKKLKLNLIGNHSHMICIDFSKSEKPGGPNPMAKWLFPLRQGSLSISL